MTEPDEALLWAREDLAKKFEPFKPYISETIRNGAWDNDAAMRASVIGYRAGAAASDARIKELEAENAALQDLAGRLRVEMSDMLTRLEERYPEDFVWLKEGDEPTDEARALLKEPDQ